MISLSSPAAGPTSRILDITVPVTVSDDSYHGVITGTPPAGSFLQSLRHYAGEDPVYCRFTLPEIGEIILPGLNSPLFDCVPVRAYDAQGRATPLEMVRLPGIYVILNQALVAFQNQGLQALQSLLLGESTSPEPAYNWLRVGRDLRRSALDMVCRLIEKRAQRVREGLGFMALAQANPNLGNYSVGVGLELAKELLNNVQQHWYETHGDKIPCPHQTVSDLAGLRLSVFMRFPATTSKSVRLDMHIVLSGRGRCVYVHPTILKVQMEGDVDGDLLFGEIDANLRKVVVPESYVPVCDCITADTLIQDFTLLDCFGLPETPWYEVYVGMDGKNGIGEITNLFYRGIVIVHSTFQASDALRQLFWNIVQRPDLEELVPRSADEETQQEFFRHLSALALMDGFHLLYEAVFDLRKTPELKPVIEAFLAAIRGQQPLDLHLLSSVVVKGEPLDVRPIGCLWNAAVHRGQSGRPVQYVNQYPIQDLFFKGRGVTYRKKELLSQILPKITAEDPAQFLFDEISGRSYTRIPLTTDDENAWEWDGVESQEQNRDDFLSGGDE